MRILYQIALITESLIGFLEVNTADALPHYVPIFPQVFDECSIRGLLEKYPTFGREKETGLPGALDT
jgi:hypothetical protein